MEHIWPLPKVEFVPFKELEETRQIALFYSGPAWDAVKDRLQHLPVAWRAEVLEATEAYWLKQSEGLTGEVIYAVGGGLVADAAKYMAARLNLPMVCLPTVLSVDAFLTWASGIRREGCVYYLDTKPPDQLVVDFEVLGGAPPTIRAAGICDVMSIATGSWDWKFAEDQGKNPPETAFIPYVYEAAQSILQGKISWVNAYAPPGGGGEYAGRIGLWESSAFSVKP